MCRSGRNPVKAGPLTKEPRHGHALSRSRLRYFVLTDDALEWWEDASVLNRAPRDRVRLRVTRAASGQAITRGPLTTRVHSHHTRALSLHACPLGRPTIRDRCRSKQGASSLSGTGTARSSSCRAGRGSRCAATTWTAGRQPCATSARAQTRAPAS
eukprot:5601628-Prymnesium_polylepis.2